MTDQTDTWSARFLPVFLLLTAGFPFLPATAAASDLPDHRVMTENALRDLGWTDPARIEGVIRYDQTMDLAKVPSLSRRAVSVVYPFVGETRPLALELAATAPFNPRSSLGFHFNGLFRFKDVEGRWHALDAWVSETCDRIRAGEFGERTDEAELCLLGMVGHCVQDFYAHSNWVALLDTFTPGDLVPGEFPIWEELMEDEGGWIERTGFPARAARGRLALSDAFVSRDERIGGLQTGCTRREPPPPGLSPWRHRHPRGAEGRVARELAERATRRWVVVMEERLGRPDQFRSLNACDHSFRRNPGMHQSMQSGSMARAASARPMSDTSQPN